MSPNTQWNQDLHKRRVWTSSSEVRCEMVVSGLLRNWNPSMCMAGAANQELRCRDLPLVLVQQSAMAREKVEDGEREQPRRMHGPAL